MTREETKAEQSPALQQWFAPPSQSHSSEELVVASNYCATTGRKIYLGDAVEVLSRFVHDHSVDLVFADPPYNIGKKFGDFDDRWPDDASYAHWCFQWLNLCLKKLKPTGSLYLMTSTQAMPYLDLYLRERMTIQTRIVWHYDSSGVQAKQRFGSVYEPILHCVMDPKTFTFNADAVAVEARTGAKRKLIDYRKPVPAPYSSTKIPGNVWYYPRVRYRMAEYEEHPTQKPESLLKRIIAASSNPGDVVLDPFSGSFTACSVAHQMGRQVIGIERNLDYFKIGLRRLHMTECWEGEQLLPPQKRFRKKEA